MIQGASLLTPNNTVLPVASLLYPYPTKDNDVFLFTMLQGDAPVGSLGPAAGYQFIRIKQPNIMNALVGIINEPIAAPWISRVNHRKRANIRCIDVLPRYNCRSLIFYLRFIPIDAMRC